MCGEGLPWGDLSSATESLALPPVVASLVDGHVFTHAAELVLPWPSAPAPAPAVQSTAWSVRGPLSALLDPGFVERHVQRGELRALTLTALDQGGAVAIVPRGQLLIVCDRLLYERLGLEGLPAAAAPKGSRFCVRVDLLEACRAPGSDAHARLLRAAQLVGPVQLLLLWELDGESAEPTFPDGVKVSRVDCEASRQAFAALRVPELAALADDEPTVADAPSASGAAADGASADRSGVAALLDALPMAAPPAAGAVCEALRWRGLLPPSTVRALLRHAVGLVESGALPWAALTAWGFADAPVSFGLTEHDHAPSGAEHDLVLVVQPDRIVLSFCLGAADRFQPERLRSGGVRHLY